jgi:thiol-disulfide isomerase/thioredoxin
MIALAQSTRTACTPAAPIAKELQALPPMMDLSRSWEERMAPRRVLARKYPDDWPVQFTLQDAIRRQLFIGREWDQAIAFYRSMPDRALGELLEARLIGPFYRKRSKEGIDRALATVPDSPWAHLAAVEWGLHPAAVSDHALAGRSFEEFRRLCPDSLIAFRSLDSVKDPEKMARHVTDLRRMIDASKNGAELRDDDVSLFRTLWTWEKIVYAGDAAEFEKRVRADLAYLRSKPQFDSHVWYSVVRSGYELSLKDAAALAALEKEALEQAPLSHTAFSILSARSWTENRPQSGATREETVALDVKRMASMLERVDRFFDRPFVRFEAGMLITRSDSKLSKEQVDRLGRFILRSAERYPDIGTSFPPYSIQVADAYARNQINLDQVPGLVAKGIEDAELQEKYRRDGDAMPTIPGRQVMDNVAFSQYRAHEILIRHAIATGDKAKATQLIANLRSELERTRPVKNADGQWSYRYSLYQQLAKQAGMEVQPVVELTPSNLERQERFPVADFVAQDLSGKTWRLADLKGKVAFVNVWTTWCGPCRAEMPLIQKLHDRWKDRPDRIVLTISADLHPMLAESLVKEGKYTFPVIFGKETAEKFFPPISFPQNWLIDAEGRRVDYRLSVPDEAGIARLEELAAKLR